MPELVHLDVVDSVATVTLDSPEHGNALSRQLVTELAGRLTATGADETVKVVVVAAAGTVFCAGPDPSEAPAESLADWPQAMVGIQRMIVSMGKPVVAKIQGRVRAGGLGIVAAADIAIASDEATFALTEVKLGVAPAVASLTLIPRMTSRAAAYSFLTGAEFSARDAERWGLVTRAVPAADLDAVVVDLSAELATGSAQGLRETKGLLTGDLLARIDAHGDEAAVLSARLLASEAAPEETAAVPLSPAR